MKNPETPACWKCESTGLTAKFLRYDPLDYTKRDADAAAARGDMLPPPGESPLYKITCHKCGNVWEGGADDVPVPLRAQN